LVRRLFVFHVPLDDELGDKAHHAERQPQKYHEGSKFTGLGLPESDCQFGEDTNVKTSDAVGSIFAIAAFFAYALFFDDTPVWRPFKGPTNQAVSDGEFWQINKRSTIKTGDTVSFWIKITNPAKPMTMQKNERQPLHQCVGKNIDAIHAKFKINCVERSIALASAMMECQGIVVADDSPLADVNKLPELPPGTDENMVIGDWLKYCSWHNRALPWINPI
jgi:hypothetical protein